jgi:hypothetical protein
MKIFKLGLDHQKSVRPLHTGPKKGKHKKKLFYLPLLA